MQTQGKIPTTPGEEQVKASRNKQTLSWKDYQRKQAFNKYTDEWVKIEDVKAYKEKKGSISSGRPKVGKEVEEGFYGKGPHGDPQVHVFKDAKGNFNIRYAPPPEIHLRFRVFPFSFMSGLSLGKMWHDDSDPSLSDSQRTTSFSATTFLSMAAMGFAFGPLVIPMMPFLPFLVKNDYRAWLHAKAVEFIAYKQILGIDTIILDWKGTVNRDMLDKLFDIAESLGMRIEIPEGSSLRNQLTGNFKHSSRRGILHYDERIKKLNENANIFEQQRNADNTTAAKESAVTLNNQEKLEKQFSTSGLTDEERQEQYKESIIREKNGVIKKDDALVDSLSGAITDLDKRLATLQEETEKQRNLIKSFDDLVKEPEKMAKELPKKPSFTQKAMDKIRSKQIALKNAEVGVAALQEKVKAMEAPINEFIKASDAETLDISRRLEVIKKELETAKQAAQLDPKITEIETKLKTAKDELTNLQTNGGNPQQIQEKEKQINELDAQATSTKDNNEKLKTKIEEQLKRVTDVETRFAAEKTEKEEIKKRFGKKDGSYAHQLDGYVANKRTTLGIK